VLALLLAGCADEKGLHAALSALETELADKQEQARQLGDRRKELGQLELNFAKLLTEIPDGGSTDFGRAEIPTVPSPPPVVIPPLAAFEGGQAERLRRQIDDTQRRIRELDKVMAVLHRIDGNKRELEHKIQRLQELKRTAP
jgi:DNA repair exonuclease SbcCD ATPase subunit